MSIADLCIESCFRSDSLHQRLTSSSVELTDLYEIRTLPDADQTDVDLDAYNTYRRQSTLPNAIPITHRDRSAEEATAVTKESILQKKPELKAIDQEMRDELGFGIESIVNILNVAIEWDATKESPAVLGSTPSILDRCVQLAGEGCRSEAAAALEWMLLRGSDLSGDVIPHWETERREKRLATSPFVVVPEGVYVLPWTAESSLRILATYLEDGRLPSTIVKALAQFRQSRNRALERDCISVLQDGGFIVVGGIKPEKASRYGMNKLSGEIDALCLDSGKKRIWVIEAKDPYVPFSAYQIRRLINDFEAQGKYVDKTLRKVADVDECKESIGQALGMPVDNHWTVTGLMLTRNVEPAAFVRNPRVIYCVLGDLVTLMALDDLPSPGFYDGDASSNESHVPGVAT